YVACERPHPEISTSMFDASTSPAATSSLSESARLRALAISVVAAHGGLLRPRSTREGCEQWVRRCRRRLRRRGSLSDVPHRESTVLRSPHAALSGRRLLRAPVGPRTDPRTTDARCEGHVSCQSSCRGRSPCRS